MLSQEDTGCASYHLCGLVRLQGRGIRKAAGNVTLVLNWCTMPIVGVLRRQHTGKAEFTFPETWEELSAATSKRRVGTSS